MFVAVVVVFSAGCSGGGGGGKNVSTGPSAGAVKWSGELCAALDEWATAVGQRMNDARNYDRATGPSGASKLAHSKTDLGVR